MKVRQLPYIDWSSPGMIDPGRAERDDESPLEDIDIDDDAPAIVIEYARAHGYRPAHPRVLPSARFSDARAEPWQCKMINARTAADETGPRSATVRMRLTSSCAGWKQRPTSEEFFEAIRAETLTGRQKAILDTWANEAQGFEVLHAWTEHAYTLRQLAAALKRAGIERCAIAEGLNRLSM